MIAFFFDREFMNSAEYEQKYHNNDQPTEIFDIFDPENGIIPWLDEHGGDHNFVGTLAKGKDNTLEIVQAGKIIQKTDNVEAENTYHNESETKNSQEITGPAAREEEQPWLTKRTKRMALFQLQSDSLVLEAARIVALKRSKDDMEAVNAGYSSRNKGSSADHNNNLSYPPIPQRTPNVRVAESTIGSCDGVDIMPESSIGKNEKYRNRLALNRKAAKRARICRNNYILEMEKQLEMLETEVQELKIKKRMLIEIEIENNKHRK